MSLKVFTSLSLMSDLGWTFCIVVSLDSIWLFVIEDHCGSEVDL